MVHPYVTVTAWLDRAFNHTIDHSGHRDRKNENTSSKPYSRAGDGSLLVITPKKNRGLMFSNTSLVYHKPLNCL